MWPYDSIPAQVQTAVIEYSFNHDHELPPTIGGKSVINTSKGIREVWIIDLCAITGGDRILRAVPEGVTQLPGPDNDNCDAGCEGCNSSYHYIWWMDEGGNVYSTCVGDECDANNEDGYQGVWP